MAKSLSKSDQKISKFIAEWLIDENGTRAAIAAGYAEKSAHVTASRLLKNPKVVDEIGNKRGKQLEKIGITADRVLNEIAKLAFFDPRKLFKADGRPKEISELDDDTAASVAGLEFEEIFDEGRVGQVRKIKIVDKGINLERLGRHLKLFTDKMDIAVKVPIEEMTDEQLAAHAASLAGKVSSASSTAATAQTRT